MNFFNIPIKTQILSMSGNESPEPAILFKIKTYIEQMANLQKALLDYLDNDDNDEVLLKVFFDQISEHQMNESPQIVTEILYLLADVSTFHHRTSQFFEKIEKIILYFDNILRDHYSNEEFYNLFRNSRRALLILQEHNYFKFDTGIIESLNGIDHIAKKFREYFKLEILPQNELLAISEDEKIDFKKKRKVGENETELCKYMRDDDVDGFATFIAQSNMPLNATFPVSVFDTNEYPSDSTSLMYYATFFGSIEIFKYLYMNDRSLIQEFGLPLAALHGFNFEILQLLEENDLLTKLFEYIKFPILYHSNELVRYILLNHCELTKQEDYKPNGKSLQYNDYMVYCLEASNYELCAEQFDNLSSDCFPLLLQVASKRNMYYIAQTLLDDYVFSTKDLSIALNIASTYGNYDIVELLLTKNVDINAISIFYFRIYMVSSINYSQHLNNSLFMTKAFRFVEFI